MRGLYTVGIDQPECSAPIISCKGGIRMARALSIWLLAALLLMLVNSAAMAKQKRPISQKSFEWMIEIEPLVFQGEVTKVEVILITPKQLYPEANSSVQIPVTEVTIKIEKIIAGDYDGDEIVIVLPEGETERATGGPAGRSRMKVNIGDHAIVAFKLDSQGTGLNIMDRDERFYRVEGTELIPYREELYLDVDKPLEVMATKAKEREMSEVFRTSNLICTGTVTKLIDLDSPSRKLVVSIDETLKGKAEQSEITVDMSNIFLPSTLQSPGFRVMLFLKKGGSGYMPVAGINGYYLIDGERVTRGHSTPVKMTASQFKSNIEMWKERER